MYTLDFTPHDLEANRRGVFSERQRQRLQEAARMIQPYNRGAQYFYAAFFVFAIVGGALIEFNNAGRDLTKFLSPANLTGFIIAGVGLTMMMLIVFIGTWWGNRQLTQPSIRSVEGKAHLVHQVMGRGGMIPAYNVEIKRGLFSKFTFRFQNAESMAHFKEGRRYRVYYVPYAIAQALSVEELDE